MKLKCALGLHSWNGCKCVSCQKIRDGEHDWAADCEKCAVCGVARQGAHDWAKDCEKCARCGKTRAGFHSWNGCKCSQCGTVRDEEHSWAKDCGKCSICGELRDNAHAWDGCKCSKCGLTRNEGHKWNGCKCSKCGATQHKWDVKTRTCLTCGQRKPPKEECRRCHKMAMVRPAPMFVLNESVYRELERDNVATTCMSCGYTVCFRCVVSGPEPYVVLPKCPHCGEVLEFYSEDSLKS